MDDLVQRVDSVLGTLGSEYHLRKARAEDGVREWIWGTWCWFDPRPLHFERHGWAPGRRLRREPEIPDSHVSCGFDESGCVLVERQYNEHGFYETFYEWNATVLEAAHYDYFSDKKPISFMVVQTEDGRAMSSDVAATNGYTREAYHWDGAVVREVKVEYAKRRDGQLESLGPWHTARATYNDHGKLQRVDLLWPASPPERPDTTVELMFERRAGRIFRGP